MLNRRKLLALGGATGAAVLLHTKGWSSAGASERGRLANLHGHHGARGALGASSAAGSAPKVDPFSVRMPVPPVLKPKWSGSGGDYYELPIRRADVEIFPGTRTPALTYDGHFIGPTIQAKRNRRVVVKFRNDLAEDSNVHLHGGHTPASSDGYPMDLIAPGASRYYAYPNRQPGSTLWYHDHAHPAASEHVFRGLHGFYLVQDEDEAPLGLPSGAYDVPVLLRDARFDENGAIVYSPYDDSPARPTLLANGRPQPYFPVAARKYRFRLLNGSNHRRLNLNLGGVEMLQIASDLGLLPKPIARTELMLSSAERAEVVIDFGRHPVGSKLVLADETGPVLRFDVVRPARDRSRVPGRLSPLSPLPHAVQVRDVELGLSDDFQMFWINGKPFDHNRVDFTIKRGSTEIWRIKNLDAEFNIHHNFHAHVASFRVLDRDGGPPLPGESGVKDTVWVPPGKSVNVQVTFGDYLGRYVYHCHMMEHSSEFGMMAQMEIVP